VTSERGAPHADRVLGHPTVRCGGHSIKIVAGGVDAYLTLGDDLSTVLLESARERRATVVLGLPAVSRGSITGLDAAFSEAGAALLVDPALGQWPPAAGVVRAARDERAGQPVLLRYAAEWGASTAWHAAEALLLAERALGPAERVFAVQPQMSPDANYLAVTVEHAGGATSLLGCGAAPDSAPASTPAPASLLLLGDSGAAEVTPEGAAVGNGDMWLDALAEWLPGALDAVRRAAPGVVEHGHWRRGLVLLEVARSAVRSGVPELAGDAP
jgi:hypothetical protein